MAWKNRFDGSGFVRLCRLIQFTAIDGDRGFRHFGTRGIARHLSFPLRWFPRQGSDPAKPSLNLVLKRPGPAPACSRMIAATQDLSSATRTASAACRIAVFQRSDVFAGAEECLLFNLRDLAARGCDSVILSFSTDRVARRFEDEGLRVERVCTLRRGSLLERDFPTRLIESLECRSKHWNLSAASRLTRWATRRELGALKGALLRERPDVFLGNISVGGDSQFLELAHSLGIGTISHQQVTPEVWMSRRAVREANDFCTEIFSNSAWTRNKWIAHGLRSDRHEVIYNRIVSSEPARGSLRELIGLDDASRLVASVGRLSPEKEFDFGIRAFAAIAADFPNWHYVIIGEGSERSRLEQVAVDAGLSARVHFTGQLADAASYFGQTDILLHPTRAEHFGRVVAEAMLRGAVVVGHNSGGVPEMIADGQNGFLFHEASGLSAVLRQACARVGDEALMKNAADRIRLLCGPENSERLAAMVARAAQWTRSRRGRVPNRG